MDKLIAALLEVLDLRIAWLLISGLWDAEQKFTSLGLGLNSMPAAVAEAQLL